MPVLGKNAHRRMVGRERKLSAKNKLKGKAYKADVSRVARKQV